MTYKISVCEDRIKFIVQEFPDVKILPHKHGSAFRDIEIEIRNSYDLLCFFHAGVRAGFMFQLKSESLLK